MKKRIPFFIKFWTYWLLTIGLSFLIVFVAVNIVLGFLWK